MNNIEQLQKGASRARKMLSSLSENIQQQKEEFQLNEYYKVYSKSEVYRLYKLT